MRCALGERHEECQLRGSGRHRRQFRGMAVHTHRSSQPGHLDATTQMMSLIFTTIGSAADYGTLGRWVLLTLTVICWSSQFTSISLTGEGTWRIIFFLPSETLPPLEPSRWGAAMALYMIGFITYGATLVFYAALFPRLARNTPRTRKLQGMYQAGEISVEEYEAEESLEKNRISNLSTVRSWFRFSSLPHGLLLEGPQQCRVYCDALPEFGSVDPFGRTP